MRFRRLWCWLFTGHRLDRVTSDDPWGDPNNVYECWCGHMLGNEPTI